MATHPSNKDPIAKIALVISAVLLLAAVYVLVASLFSTISRNSTKGEIDTDTLVANNVAMTQKVIQPIGEVTTSDGSGKVAAAGPARSGEEVYTAVCQTCHATGVAEAPRIDDKAAWESRIANGFDGLMKTAIEGKGAMPARGGQNVPDAELKASIAYMINKVGINLDIPKDEPATAAAPEKAEEKSSSESSTPEASKAVEAATPVAPANPVAPEKTAAPEAGKAVEATTPEAPANPAAPEKAAAPEAPKTPDAPPAPEAAPAVAMATTATALETAAAPATAEAETPAAKSGTNELGEKIYKATCFACHGLGVAGAPKTSDKTAWEARIAKGNDTLYTSAIKGMQGETGVMPPKGGNFSISDDEVKAAVDYMVSQSQ